MTAQGDVCSVVGDDNTLGNTFIRSYLDSAACTSKLSFEIAPVLSDLEVMYLSNSEQVFSTAKQLLLR